MLKAEFKEEKKEVSHVGLYRSRLNGFIVFFSNENNDKEGVVVSSELGSWAVGEVNERFVSCLEESQWEKLEVNQITLSW